MKQLYKTNKRAYDVLKAKQLLPMKLIILFPIFIHTIIPNHCYYTYTSEMKILE
jgi:hypothetical protein